MKIEIVNDSRFGYVLMVDGETTLECLGEDELKSLTIGEIMELVKEC